MTAEEKCKERQLRVEAASCRLNLRARRWKPRLLYGVGASTGEGTMGEGTTCGVGEALGEGDGAGG